MSQENVEIVRAAYDAWNAGDTDAVRAFHHPNVIARYGAAWPEPGPFVGRDAVVRQIEELRQTWDASRADTTTDFIDAGDRVIAEFVWRGTGRGPAFRLEGAAVYTMRNGMIFEIEYFGNLAEALEAVGMSEQNARADS
jgi:ketosteroid isomerase-like protein